MGFQFSLGGLFGRRSEPKTPAPAYREVDCYVSWYHDKLDGVAKLLSGNKKIDTRFNSLTARVELFDQATEEVVARVSMHGECGAPYVAIIETSLSEHDRSLFSTAIPFEIDFRPLIQASAV